MVWVKICGITRPEDARAAAGVGADAIGFLCWPGSSRYIAPSGVAEIAAGLPDGVSRVGVFVNQDAVEIREIARRAGLTHIQLHGDEQPGMLDDLAPLSLPVIRAFRQAPGQDQLAAWRRAFALLADGAAPGAYGGTGTPADDQLIAAAGAHPQLILAGGLTPDNVADRIAAVQPWGVDASSGLETAPGMKAPLAIRQFVANARSVAA